MQFISCYLFIMIWFINIYFFNNNFSFQNISKCIINNINSNVDSTADQGEEKDPISA